MSKRPSLIRASLIRASLIRAFLVWSLLLSLPLAAVAAKPAKPVVAGVDYVEIEHRQTWRPVDGKIEVAEVFAYWCHHCANLQPSLEAWKARLPADVHVAYVPLPYDSKDTLARAYFAAESLGVLGKTHAATFRAIHADAGLPKQPSAGELADFYAGLGIERAAWQRSFDGFDMGNKLRRAYQFAIAAGVQGTPTLIVDGRYRVLGRRLEDMLPIASQLVERVRRERAATTRSAAR
jgi:thiol:disulfide interchange protein DsbA